MAGVDGYTDVDRRHAEMKREAECNGQQQVNERLAYAPGLATELLEKQRAQMEYDIRVRFAYHPPRGTQVQRYELFREDFTNLAVRVMRHTQPGRAQDAAIEALHIAMMLANRAIALE